jgi:paraquat-inducible protein B
MDDRPQPGGGRAKTYEQASPFYKPLWRRIAITAAVAAWLAFEIYNNEGLWITIAGAMLAYAIWTFFLTWPKTPPDDTSK